MHDSIDPTEPAHQTRSRETDASLGRAIALVRFLRERCPWDARQNPASLRPYLLEEAHEVADAIDARDDHALAAELGDLLLNVAFQIALAEERGSFDAEEVVARLEAKMEARHPHVYGDAEHPPDWEEMKARERVDAAQAPSGSYVDPSPGDPGTVDPASSHLASSDGDLDPFAGVPLALEPLSRAMRVQERMAALGFDWPDITGPLEKVREETAELEKALAEETAAELSAATSAATSPESSADSALNDPAPTRAPGAAPAVEEEVGDLLFAVVNTARLAGTHPSNALLGAIRKFERRCRAMGELGAERGLAWQSASLEELDTLWDEVKAAEEASGGDKPPDGHP